MEGAGKAEAFEGQGRPPLELRLLLGRRGRRDWRSPGAKGASAWSRPGAKSSDVRRSYGKSQALASDPCLHLPYHCGLCDPG